MSTTPPSTTPLSTARRTGLQFLLLLAYLLVLTPVGLVARRFRDPLDRAVDRTAASYWITS
ncbi:hypothetical protein ACFVFS_39915 [Kitasatospora sp. NPDC057692]|uniref:hypothetical protein n=1 Tax=Kitasatospora sp. NPDC057692 TaxID=3346215 RepID=UPI003674068D